MCVALRDWLGLLDLLGFLVWRGMLALRALLDWLALLALHGLLDVLSLLGLSYFYWLFLSLYLTKKTD